MSLWDKIKPQFWDHHEGASGSHMRLLDFRRKWKLIVMLSSIVTLTPLVIMAFVDYGLTRRAMEEQLTLHTSRLVSNTWRSLSIFFAERRSALKFVLEDNTLEDLGDPRRLQAVLEHLAKSVGGFVDIGVVDADGMLVSYAGPHDLRGSDLCNEPCLRQVVRLGSFVSKLETVGGGRRQELVMAIRRPLPDGGYFILRASLDAGPLHRLLRELEIDAEDDAFLVDGDGVLQTPSRRYGAVFGRIDLPVPPVDDKTRVTEVEKPSGERVVLGYARVPETAFVLMVIRKKAEAMRLWWQPRIRLVGFLILSIVVILFAILGMATFLVHRIHAADQRRVTELHRVEYVNKLASIERLAAGMAHEINNPLAIINEKAGLVGDLLKMQGRGDLDARFFALLDSIKSAVHRCGAITQRLLNFARHIDVAIQPVDVGELVRGMVAFVTSEARKKGIDIRLRIPDELPGIRSDPSHLQQIFLNILNNSFAAVEAGGRLEISVGREGNDGIAVVIADNGCGISDRDIKHIFEPFFTTRSRNGGTGLGLSITHGLVQKLGGRIEVRSEVGAGTRFSVFLPMDAGAAGETGGGSQ